MLQDLLELTSKVLKEVLVFHEKALSEIWEDLQAVVQYKVFINS